MNSRRDPNTFCIRAALVYAYHSSQCPPVVRSRYCKSWDTWHCKVIYENHIEWQQQWINLVLSLWFLLFDLGVSLQDALPAVWRMDFVCTTRILSKRRRNKVTCKSVILYIYFVRISAEAIISFLSSKILYHHGLQLVTVVPLQFLMEIPCESRLLAAVKDCGVGICLIARLKTVEWKWGPPKKAPWKAWIGRTGAGYLAASDPKIRVRALSSIRVHLGSLLCTRVTHPTKVYVWGNPEIFTYSCLHE